MFKKNINFGFDMKWDRLPDDNLFKRHISLIYNAMEDVNSPDIHVVNGLPMFFRKSEKAISLNFSGGADSTMLFYLLCRIIESTGAKTKICVSNLVRFWEDRSWTEDNAREIFNYIDAMFVKNSRRNGIQHMFLSVKFQRMPGIWTTLKPGYYIILRS